jgi:glycosyltransferase involved in cell wall biosynthesis
MAQKRLALVCKHFYPEMVSTGMHMTEIARRLQEKGWQITVYCDQPEYTVEEDEEKVPPELLHEGIRIRHVPVLGQHRDGMMKRGVRAVTYLLSTIRALVCDRDQYDGLLTTTNPPFAGLAGWYMSVVHGLPYVQLVYDVYPDIAEELGAIGKGSVLARVWEQASRQMLNQAVGTIVIGRDMAELVREKLRRGNWGTVHLIPNWSDKRTVEPVSRDENPFRQEHEVGDRILVQYSGRMGATHNLEPLIEAAERLQDAPVLFQFNGEGAKKEKLQRMTDERGLENVTFLPYQPMEDLDTVLSAADLGVVCLERRFTGMSVPSKTYGIMASGTPILGFVQIESEVGQTLLEHKCGIVAEDPTGGEVAAIVRELIADRDRLAAVGRNGREAFENNYTLSHAAERYDHILLQTIYGADVYDMT